MGPTGPGPGFAELGIILPDSYGPDMWEPVAPMAQVRQDFAAVSWGGTLAIALGGYDGSQTLSSTEIFSGESSIGRPDRRW